MGRAIASTAKEIGVESRQLILQLLRNCLFFAHGLVGDSQLGGYNRHSGGFLLSALAATNASES